MTFTPAEKKKIIESLRKVIPPEKVQADERRILTALRDAGIEVRSVQDLIGRWIPREAAVVLTEMLPEIVAMNWKSIVAQALITDSARGIAERTLLREFVSMNPVRPREFDAKWTIGWALGCLANPDLYDEMLEIAQDRRHGAARRMLIEEMHRFKDPRVVDVLIGLLGDRQVRGGAIFALRKLHPAKARSHLEPLLSDPDKYIREEARKAIGAIDRAIARERERELKKSSHSKRGQESNGAD